MTFLPTGGGILDIEVVDTLKVDGYIWANSRDLVGDRSGGSGGSGGSILIRTGNFTGTGQRTRADKSSVTSLKSSVMSLKSSVTSLKSSVTSLSLSSTCYKNILFSLKQRVRSFSFPT